jgi:hypothetical protein
VKTRNNQTDPLPDELANIGRDTLAISCPLGTPGVRVAPFRVGPPPRQIAWAGLPCGPSKQVVPGGPVVTPPHLSGPKERPRCRWGLGGVNGRLQARAARAAWGFEPSVGCQFVTPAGETVCAPLPKIVNARIQFWCCVRVTVSGSCYLVG